MRLEGEAGSFTTITDDRGVFTFERVPVARYRLEITTADGKVIRKSLRAESFDARRTRVRLTLARGPSGSLGIEPRRDEDRVVVVVPEPATRWGKLGKEMLIFLGVAGLLAL